MPLKKNYTLDYSIERDTDRVAAVVDKLDQLSSEPTQSDLELMADYILYGKDENGLNAFKRGELTNGQTRFNSFKTKDDKLESLEAITDNPLSDQQDLKTELKRDIYMKKVRNINRPKYNKKTGEMVDAGDSDIPFMTQLWESIDTLERWIGVLEGKLPPQPGDEVFNDSYRLYQLKHILIDLRRHQYYLKDFYKPTIYFLNLDKPRAQYYDWTADSFYWITYEEWFSRTQNALLHTVSRNLADYETRGTTPNLEVKWVVRHHTFDWENPFHIKNLINYYEMLYEAMHDKIDTYGYTLLLDFERYRRMAHLSPVREFLLDQKIAHASYPQIMPELMSRFGVKYNENRVSTIVAQEIPKKIAQAAAKHRLIMDTPDEEKKKCYHCGRLLPRTNLFFAYNRSRRDGFSSSCKECEKQMRIARGGQTEFDKRSKDTTMLEVSPATSRA